jgi:hypothetical protein
MFIYSLLIFIALMAFASASASCQRPTNSTVGSVTCLCECCIHTGSTACSPVAQAAFLVDNCDICFKGDLCAQKFPKYCAANPGPLDSRIGLCC